MKNTTFILLLIFNSFLLSCQNSDNGVWNSKNSTLQINFDKEWKLITPQLDTERKILVGVTDETDHSSLTIKITDDVPKNQLSDEDYYSALKEQMLSVNSTNKLLGESEIEFKEKIYHRLSFSLSTKFGDVIHTIYILRNEKKMIGIQFTYPKSLATESEDKLPSKIEKLLNGIRV